MKAFLWLSRLTSRFQPDDTLVKILETAPFFVIVHEYCVRKRRVKQVIKRIKKHGEYTKINNSPFEISPNLPRKKILVCGAYKSLCVTFQLHALKKAGYDAEICEIASE